MIIWSNITSKEVSVSQIVIFLILISLRIFITMSVANVKISSDVYMACLHHAFTTEAEEVMGLLIGQYKSVSFFVYIHKLHFDTYVTV